MKTSRPPGLDDDCAHLDLPPHLLELVLTLLLPRWQRLHPSRPVGRPRTPLRVLLVGVLTYLRDGSTFRRAAGGRLPRSTLHQHFREVVGLLAGVGLAQPDGTLLIEEELEEWLREVKESGEVVLLDGMATRCPRPGGWYDQKPWYDYKNSQHDHSALTLTTATGDLLAVHGGWPGGTSEPHQARHASFAPALRGSGVMVVTDRGFRAARDSLPVTAPNGNHKTPKPGDAEVTRARAENERPHSLLKSWRIMDRTRLRGRRRWEGFDQVTRAVAVLVQLTAYGDRVRVE